MVAWHPGVVLVDLAVARLPVVELAGADTDPEQEAADGDLGLIGPGAHEVHDLVARVVGDPASRQGSPSSFFSWMCSSMSSERTSFLRCSLASSCSILRCLASSAALDFAVVLEGSVAVLEELLLPAIEQVGADAQFIAEIGDRRLLERGGV